MVFEICAALGTAALVVFLFYGLGVLRAFKMAAKRARLTLSKIDHDLPELTKLVRNAASLTSDVKEKIDAFNFLFKPLARLSGQLERKGRSAKRKKTK